MNGDPIVMMTRAELRALVSEALIEALATHEPSEAPALLTSDQLCQALQISRSSLYVLRERGLPHVQLLDSPRFALGEVLAWLRAGATVASKLNEPPGTRSKRQETGENEVQSDDFQHGTSCTVTKLSPISRRSTLQARPKQDA